MKYYIYILFLFASFGVLGQTQSDTSLVYINSLPPAPTMSASATTILNGQSTTLTASGCSGRITWNSGATGSTLTVSPNVTTTYTAYCTSTAGCVGATAQKVIEVITGTPTIQADKNEICVGETVTINGYGCNGTYNWSTGATGGSITVTPNQTTTYSVFCSSSAGNSPSVSTKITVYGYENTPTVNSITITSGQSATLTASGCNSSYLWSTGATGATITITPSSTTTYKVKCNGRCPSADVTGTVTVISPNVNVSASPDKICSGQSSVLTASGCNGTYKWSTGALGGSITVTPNQTTTYSVICSTSAGESTPSFVTVTVFPIPSKPIMFGDTLIVAGKTATLRAVCSASSVRWSTGDSTETIIVKPLKTTWYKAYCISTAGCIGKTDSIRVKVTSNPIEIIPKTKPVILVKNRKTISICEGEKETLNLVGCEPSSKVLWNTGQSTMSIIVSPIKNTSYWASCTDAIGIKYDSIDVVVLPKSKITASKDTTKGIIGNTISLKVNNCNGKVTWIENNGKYNQISGDSIRVVVTTQTTTYKAFCTNSNGCNSDTLSFVVVGLPNKPTITKPEKVCENATIQLSGSGCPSNTQLVWEQKREGKINTFKQNVFEFKYSSKDTYTAYCMLKDGTKGDTTHIVLKPSQITYDNLVLYPNPTYDELKIKSEGCLNGVMVRLYDISGRLLFNGLGNEINDIKSINLEDLPTGEYVIQLVSDEIRKNISKMILKANRNEK